MPSAWAICGCASCSSVKAVCTGNWTSASDLPTASDLPGELTPFPPQRLLDGAPLAVRTPRLEAHGQRQFFVAVAIQKRNGAAAQGRVDLALFRMHAVAASFGDRGVDVRPGRFGARRESGKRLER